MGYRAISLTLFLATALVSGCGSLEIVHEPVPNERMASVPAGRFVMGSDAGPASSAPAHRVYVSAFEIAVTEVTNEQFRSYVEESGSVPLVWREGFPTSGPRLPVTGILWKEAEAFCRWYGWRLPTEAEWEKAARGSDGRTYPWGNEWDPALANTVESGRGGVTDVGAQPGGRSPYGALDMVGNVQEWVSDFYDPAYYLNSPMSDPGGPQQILDHGLRGGSWASPREQATTFFRDSSHSVRPNFRVGFRCVRDP